MGLAFFADSGLTQPLPSLQVSQATDGSSTAADRVIWLGSTARKKRYRAASAPGVAPIVVSLSDAATGSGVAVANVALATSAAGLVTAIGGAPLALGPQLLSGSGNAIAVHLRIKTAALAAATYADLTLAVNLLQEEGI